MKLEFSSDSPTTIEADALLIGRFENGSLPADLHSLLGEAATDLLTDLKGKPSEDVAVLYPQGAIGAKRLLIVGLGSEEKLTLETLRRAAAKGAAKAQSLGLTTLATTLGQHQGNGFTVSDSSRAVTEAMELALYRYSLKQKKNESTESALSSVTLLGVEGSAQQTARLGQAIASGVRLARDLVNAPPNLVDAPYFVKVARGFAEASPHVKTTIITRDEAVAMGMGAFGGVSQGSATPSFVIVMEYRVEELKDQQPVGLVGKGLIFDTGGISIKPGTDLWKMKTDMGGGAAVLGTFQALIDLPEPLDLPIVGVVPATDNAIGHGAFTPADVLTALNGKTIEIQNTDAEGRLILADALTYIDRYKPRAVVDLATLTGAIVIALGPNLTGMFSNDDDLAARLQAAAAQSGEELWRLPLHEDYEKLLESDIADLRNIGGRGAGAITAALFLQNFIGEYPWAHLDIAGTAWGDERKPKLPYNSKGASGVGVRLLMELLLDYAGQS